MSQSRQEEFSKKLTWLGQGAFSGVIGRGVTWIPEYIYLQKILYGPTKSYSAIAAHLYNFKNVKTIQNEFFKTGFLQTLGKSGSNMAIAYLVERSYPQLSPWQNAFAIALLCTPVETKVTMKPERNKVRNFNKHATSTNLKDTKNLAPQELKNIRNVTLCRTFFPSLLTFGFMSHTHKTLKDNFPHLAHTATMKAGASFLGAFFAQPLIMPFIKLQNDVFIHPEKAIIPHTITTLKNNPLSFFHGLVGRMGCQSFRYAASYTLLEFMKPF